MHDLLHFTHSFNHPFLHRSEIVPSDSRIRCELEVRGSNPSRLTPVRDLNIGQVLATLLDARRHGVGAGTG